MAVGGARFVNDEPVAALELQTEALALFRETSPVDDARAAEVLNSRGTVLQHLERLDEAEADFAAALQIQQARAGASADVAAVLSNLAQIAHTRGDYQTAEQRYRRVLEIARATLSPADPALGVGNIRAQRRRRDLYTYQYPQSLMAERCRGIRTSLTFMLSTDRSLVLLVTSPASSEGKSSTA